jgi:hypothetical protein
VRDKRGVCEAVAAVVVAMATTGCWNNLPPPAAPAKVLPAPAVELGPPPPGASTVLFDADRPAQVIEVGPTMQASGLGWGASATMTRPLCLTPCAVHLAQGTHQLVFQPAGANSWAGDGIVQVGQNPVAYRYALGHSHPRIGARVGGWVLVGIGLGLTATGALYWSFGNDSRLGSDLTSYGEVQTFVGTGLVVAGAVMLSIFRPELQPGAGVQWELPGDAAPGQRASRTVSR